MAFFKKYAKNLKQKAVEHYEKRKAIKSIEKKAYYNQKAIEAEKIGVALAKGETEQRLKPRPTTGQRLVSLSQGMSSDILGHKKKRKSGPLNILPGESVRKHLTKKKKRKKQKRRKKKKGGKR